jgi:hypothetical protein
MRPQSAASEVGSMLAANAQPESRAKLESLLSVSDSGHNSRLDQLRKGPYRRSALELVRALQRVPPATSVHIRQWLPITGKLVG